MGKWPNIVEFTSTESGDGGRQREDGERHQSDKPGPFEKKGACVYSLTLSTLCNLRSSFWRFQFPYCLPVCVCVRVYVSRCVCVYDEIHFIKIKLTCDKCCEIYHKIIYYTNVCRSVSLTLPLSLYLYLSHSHLSPSLSLALLWLSRTMNVLFDIYLNFSFATQNETNRMLRTALSPPHPCPRPCLPYNPISNTHS